MGGFYAFRSLGGPEYIGKIQGGIFATIGRAEEVHVDPNDPVPPARAGGRSPARRRALGTAGGSRSRAGATGADHAPLVYAESALI